MVVKLESHEKTSKPFEVHPIPKVRLIKSYMENETVQIEWRGQLLTAHVIQKFVLRREAEDFARKHNICHKSPLAPPTPEEERENVVIELLLDGGGRRYVPKLRSQLTSYSEESTFNVVHNRMKYKCIIFDTSTSARNASRRSQDLNNSIGLTIQNKKRRSTFSKKNVHSKTPNVTRLTEWQHRNNDEVEAGPSGTEIRQTSSAATTTVKGFKSAQPKHMLSEDLVMKFMNSIREIGSEYEYCLVDKNFYEYINGDAGKANEMFQRENLLKYWKIIIPIFQGYWKMVMVNNVSRSIKYHDSLIGVPLAKAQCGQKIMGDILAYLRGNDESSKNVSYQKMFAFENCHSSEYNNCGEIICSYFYNDVIKRTYFKLLNKQEIMEMIQDNSG